MKKSFIYVLFSISILCGQDFPRGIYIDNRSSGMDYTFLQDSLKLNMLEVTISDSFDVLFSKSFKLLIREINLWGYSTGQKMVYEAEEGIQSSGLRNYFALKHQNASFPDSTIRLSVGAGAGMMVDSAKPDDEYHYFEPGRKWYTAKFILKMDTTGSGAKDTTKIIDIIIVSKTLTLNTVDTMRMLRRNSFTSNNTFQTFELRFKVDSITPSPPPPKKWDVLTGGALTLTPYQEKIDLQVYWHGNVTTYLDKVIVEDDTAKILFAGLADTRIYNAAHPYTSKSQLKRFYLFDEPPVSALLGYDYVDKKLQNLSFGLQDTGITTTFWKGNQLDRFIADAHPAEILMDRYAINPYVPYPGLSNDTADAVGITRYSEWLYKRNLNERLLLFLDPELGSVAVKTKNSSKSFWYVPQLNGMYDRNTNHYYALRPLTSNEIVATTGLGLAFGAKGIIGWLYRTYGDGSYIYVGMVDSAYNYTTNYLTTGGSFFGGFNNTYKGYKKVMEKVETLSSTLASLQWQGLKRWFYVENDITYGTWNGLVTNVLTKNISGVSDTISPASQIYVSTGHFKDASSYDYILAVNRRCDASDTRNITQTLNYATQWRILEKGTTDTTISDDQGSFTKLFTPGDWKLFKILQRGPSIPQNVTVTSYSNHAKVSWSKNTPASPLQSISGYQIYRNPGGLIATVSSSDSFYIDNQVVVGSGGNTIYYWVKAKDVTNLVSSASSQVSIGNTHWEDKKQVQLEELVDIPKEFALKENYPNPFNPTTTVKYELPQDVFVTVKIFNQLGQELKILVKEFKSAGRYQVEWNAKGFASGLYICKIEAGTFKQSKKMILTK